MPTAGRSFIDMAAFARRTADTLEWTRGGACTPVPTPKVLLVEPHVDTLELYELWLTQQRFEVSVAATGREAVSVARRVRPDVVVVEPMVSDGGLPLLEALRGGQCGSDPLLVVLTTQTSPLVRRQALAAGAHAYVVKPCGVFQLGDVLADVSWSRFRGLEAAARTDASSRVALEAGRLAMAIRLRLDGGSGGPSRYHH
jgi:DNA-binding response OmpR family regulator